MNMSPSALNVVMDRYLSCLHHSYLLSSLFIPRKTRGGCKEGTKELMQLSGRPGKLRSRRSHVIPT